MNAVYESLADRAYNILRKSGQPRVVIVVAGAPGSGKTTLSSEVAAVLNARHPGDVPMACVVGMDGYHLTRAQLDAMPDPATAHERRGAPFTFDADGVVDLVVQLRESAHGSTKPILTPSFDHSIKDPVADDIVIPPPPTAPIVFLEGLYLLLKDEPWNRIADLVDDKWYIEVSPAIARRRVALRHVASGITPTVELGYARADGNDAANGLYIARNSIEADIIIHSIDEPTEGFVASTEAHPLTASATVVS